MSETFEQKATRWAGLVVLIIHPSFRLRVHQASRDAWSEWRRRWEPVGGSTSGSLSFLQSAIGGAGGSGRIASGGPTIGGTGGDATSILLLNDNSAKSLSGTVGATGGAGGMTFFTSTPGAGATGGDASAIIALASSHNGTNVTALANAFGGSGGAAIPLGTINGGTQGGAGMASATASASAMGSGIASAIANATGAGGGAAFASSQSTATSGQRILASAGAPVSGSAGAISQTSFGGPVSSTNALTTGQSVSTVSASMAGATMHASGAMGAAYGGTGAALTYRETAEFILNTMGNGVFPIDPLGGFSLGSGFESAMLQVLLNGTVFRSQTFNSLASAEAFFSPQSLIKMSLAAGLNEIQLIFDETLSSGQGFGFGYRTMGAAPDIAAALLPPSWTMMLIGLFALAVLVYRRQKNSAVSAV